MDFIKSLFSKKTQKDEWYLGIFLKEEEGMVLYIEDRAKALRVKTFSKFKYSNGWENLTQDLDEVLSKLEQETGQAPEKAILFVYSYLIDEHSKQIKKPYIDKIKAFVKNLDLKPMGYIDGNEAVVAGLEKREDMPLTAVVMELDRTNLQVFVYKGGKTVFKKHIMRSNDFMEDVMPVLAEARDQFVLPSRIILYDSGNLDVEAGKILTHRFADDMFIQMPKVEIVKNDDLINDLLDIFSNQLASEVIAPQGAVPETEVEAKDEAHSMGFVIGGEAPEREEAPAVEFAREVPLQPDEQDAYDDVRPSRDTEGRTPLRVDTVLKNPSVIALAGRVKTGLAKLRTLPFPVLPVAGALLVVLAVLLIEYFFHTATVTLYLPSQEVGKEVELTATTNKGEKPDLLLTKATKQTSISEQANTTGKREVGKKATGEVTLHNFSDEERTFAKDTELSVGDSIFVLLGEVKVASASLAADASAKLPGKAKGNIEAAVIGPEYNLEKGKRFSIGGLSSSSYFGINDANLSGGQKEEIRTVSADDIERIQNNILKKADAYIASQVKGKTTQGTKIIDSLTEKEISKFESTREVGEEANEVKGEGTVEVTYYSYLDAQLRNALAVELREEVKSDFKVDPAKVTYTAEDISGEDGDYTITLDAKAKAAEDIKTADIAALLKGKRVKKLADTAKETYKAEALEYEVRDPIPFMDSFMPFFKRNIEVKIEYP